MNEKLNPRRVRLENSVTSDKMRRSHKPLWTEEFSHLWNGMCVAEKNGEMKSTREKRN